MEKLQARHRKEQRDLQSRIIQKKKSATKKTRKGVNDECGRLEQELKQRQASEIAAFNGVEVNGASDAPDDGSLESDHDASEILANLDLAAKPPQRPDAQEEQQEQFRKKNNRQKARLARRAAEQKALAEQAAR